MANPHNIRSRFEQALAGQAVTHPVYAVYDWFVQNRPAVDWQGLFDLGLGQINHANVIRHEHPHFEIVQTTSEQGGQVRQDTRLVTEHGELHQWYLGEWRQEHFIKTPADYRLMTQALEGVTVLPDDAPFKKSEAALGQGGVTVGQVKGLGEGRTPLMVLQIDWVGLEQFSMDLAYEVPELFELLERMNEIKVEEFRQAVKSPAAQIKLWENLSIDTIGPVQYRKHLAPLYRKIIDIVHGAGKKLQVHYDGRLKIIADDIAQLGIDGIDSLTEPPEGSMLIGEARQAWPDKFLWVHPNLHWYRLPPAELAQNIRRAVQQAGPRQFCLMISEEVPPNWREAVPVVLDTLQN